MFSSFQTTGPDAVAAIQGEYNDLIDWLFKKIQYLEHQEETNSLSRNYSDFLNFKSEVDVKEIIYNKLRTLVNSQSMISITLDSWKEIQQLWMKLEYLMRRWLWMLDSKLPPDFGSIGEWMAKAEYLIYFDDLPSTLDEKTAAIISKKLEEHNTFFADLPSVIERFENAKHSPSAIQVPGDQLHNMEMRLRVLPSKATERCARLKFLEHKCCLVAFLNLTEIKLRGWTVKYGRLPEVEKFLEEYQNFVSRNKIFHEFNKAFVDIQQVIDEYRRTCNIDMKENAEIDRFMREVAEKWKNISMELRCVQSMLEEAVTYWQRWIPLADEFEGWLSKANTMVNAEEDQRMEFFQDISLWKDKHQLLTDTVSFLVATCEDSVAMELKNRYTNMTSQWERLFPDVKHYMHAGDILRYRKDYKAGIESLSNWLRNAETVLDSTPLASTDKIKQYGDQLVKLQSEVESVEELFKNISKSFQNMLTELPRDEVDKIMNTLKKEKEALVKVRALIPVKLHLYHQLLVQQESLESGQREINAWLNKAEDLLSQITYTGGKETLLKELDAYKSFFSRTMYYKSMLESKNKVFQNIIKSVDQDKSIDTSESVQTMRELNERFARVTQQAHQCDLRLQEASRCMTNFSDCVRAMMEWLNQADMLISDKHNIETKQSVEHHKNFFTKVNDRLLHDLIQTGNDLIKCIPIDEQHEVKETVEKLQAKWHQVLSFAPLHLVRLEFRLDETVFQQYLKDIEKEINFEQQVRTLLFEPCYTYLHINQYNFG